MQTLTQTDALRNLSALVDFSKLINSSLEVDFILNNLLLTCFGKFHTTKGVIALVEQNGNIRLGITKGFRVDIKENFPQLNINKYSSTGLFNEFIEKYNLRVVKEIKTENRIRGFLFLGERLTKIDYSKQDNDFIETIINLGATALENSLIVAELKKVNRDLDGKVNQLSSLFDLGKEFSSILEEKMVVKLLVYSIIGQMLVSKYAVVSCKDGKPEILDSKFNSDQLLTALSDDVITRINGPVTEDTLCEEFPALSDLGIKLLVPMQIKGKNRGYILLGKRSTKIPYSKSDIEFVSSLGSLAIISIENSHLFKETLEKQRMEKDLEIARNIQKNLLPKKIPTLENFEINAFNLSAKQVGGDYYDVAKLDNNRCLFAVADVSGKGVQAALLMANLQAFLKSICKMNIELDKASNLINDLVSENTTDGSFITFFWGIIDDQNRELKYCNMGHNPPLLIRDGAIRKLKVGGMILGVMPTMFPYETESVSLIPGDVLVLFTDGITEAMNTLEEEYSDERLEELSVALASESSDDIMEKILADVREYTKGAQQSDDITCMVIKVK